MYKSRVDGDKTKEYLLFTAMKRRCKFNYKDCSIDDRFQDFQYFAEWCNNQIGFNMSNYQLDKDILFQGNKIYSPETCVFIPKDLNCFNRVNEGKYKQGVCWHEGTGKYRARIQVVGSKERVCLGLYYTEQTAYLAYKQAKEAEAQRWYERLNSGEFVVDSRVTERMRTWQLEG